MSENNVKKYCQFSLYQNIHFETLRFICIANLPVTISISKTKNTLKDWHSKKNWNHCGMNRNLDIGYNKYKRNCMEWNFPFSEVSNVGHYMNLKIKP
jgi:hypothetical protein